MALPPKVSTLKHVTFSLSDGVETSQEHSLHASGYKISLLSTASQPLSFSVKALEGGDVDNSGPFFCLDQDIFSDPIYTWDRKGCCLRTVGFVMSLLFSINKEKRQ